MHRRAFLELAAGGALTAAVPSLAYARSRAGGTPLAFATADNEASVVVLDLASGAVRQHIGTIGGPSSIETVGGGRIALVGHAEAGAISLIDVARLRVTHELEGFGEPRYAAAGPGGRYAYVTDASRGEIAVIDLQRARVSDRVHAGALARHLTISPNGRTLFAALGPKATAVAVLDASDPRHPRLVRTFVPVDRAHDVVVSADGRTLWVTSGVTPQVAVHDVRTLAPIARIDAGAPPQHVAIGGGRVFVASGADGQMHVFRADRRRLRTTRIPLDSYNVTWGSGHVVTPSVVLGTVTTLGRTGAFIRRERVSDAAHDACIALWPA
jgi:DNA-binding beta-propeller fold protein YncE